MTDRHTQYYNIMSSNQTQQHMQQSHIVNLTVAATKHVSDIKPTMY